MIKQAQDALATAKARFKAAAKEEKRLRSALREKTEPLQTQIAELESQVRTIDKAAQPEIIDAEQARYEARGSIIDAQRALHDVYTQVAAAEVTDENRMSPSDIAAGLDAVIKSRREVYCRTLGYCILDELVGQQKNGGLQMWHVQRVYTYAKSGRAIEITEPQAERAWAYLNEVCIKRGDDGLAPPFVDPK